MHYLDHNATAPMRPLVFDAMVDAGRSARNAMSLHHHGRKARVISDQARELLREILGFPKAEVIYTSGGTEADNLALIGFARARRRETGRSVIVLSPWEHPAIEEPAHDLKRDGFEIRYLPVDSSGSLDLKAAERVLDDSVSIAAVMLAQNETGIVFDLSSVASICHQRAIHLHCDAVQAVGKIPVKAMELGVDSLALSAHKFGGPRGIGALLTMKGSRPDALWGGGGQEEGTRSGTHPVPLISGMAKALELASLELGKYAEIRKKHNKFEARLVDELGLGVIGAQLERLPNTSSLWVPQVPGLDWVTELSGRGFAVSAGAACHAGEAGPSRIHGLCGQTDTSLGMLRVSSGLETEAAALDSLVDALKEILARRAE